MIKEQELDAMKRFCGGILQYIHLLNSISIDDHQSAHHGEPAVEPSDNQTLDDMETELHRLRAIIVQDQDIDQPDEQQTPGIPIFTGCFSEDLTISDLTFSKPSPDLYIVQIIERDHTVAGMQGTNTTYSLATEDKLPVILHRVMCGTIYSCGRGWSECTKYGMQKDILNLKNPGMWTKYPDGSLEYWGIEMTDRLLSFRRINVPQDKLKQYLHTRYPSRKETRAAPPIDKVELSRGSKAYGGRLFNIYAIREGRWIKKVHPVETTLMREDAGRWNRAATDEAIREYGVLNAWVAVPCDRPLELKTTFCDYQLQDAVCPQMQHMINVYDNLNNGWVVTFEPRTVTKVRTDAPAWNEEQARAHVEGAGLWSSFTTVPVGEVTPYD
jgi:hypothetical protein